MNAGIENKIVSSFALWLDNRLLKNGGYTNVSGSFYRVQDTFSNYSTFGAPFAQFVSDTSISGANVLSGVYINNTIVYTGSNSGLVDINYNNGQLYFTGSYANNFPISGHYAVKDFNIKITENSEETILFKQKYQLRPKYPQTITGIAKDVVTYPLVYIRSDGGPSNEGWAFGGTDIAKFNIRCIVLADSLYNLHAVQSILRNTVRTPVALFEASEQPYNIRGGTKFVYNYYSMSTQKIDNQQFAWIEAVRIPRTSQSFTVDSKLLNPDVFFNFVDFELSIVGDFRQC